VETSAWGASVAETTGRDAEIEVPVTEVHATDATEILDEAEVPHQPEVWTCGSRVVFGWLVIFEHLNNVFNLRRFHTGLGLCGIWMLFVWTCLVVKLLKFLVLVIYLFALRRLMPSSPKAVVMTQEFWAKMDMMNEISHGGNASVGSSSVNTEELWTEMDMMDEISHGGTSVGNIPRNTHRERRSLPSVEKTGECAGRVDKRALLNDTPVPSNTQPRGSGKDSMKKKAAWILSAALRAISLPMRRSFVDRQHSPLTGMDLNEWKIFWMSLLVWVTL
jgi:hypothetical protein